MTLDLIMDIEWWKDIPGFEGLYQASTKGRIRSLERLNSAGRIRKERIMKVRTDKDGYLKVGLTKNGKQKSFMVHRLVWEAFNGPIPKGMQINHLNERKTDNRLENLFLMSCKENINWGTGIERGHNTLKKGTRCKPVEQYDLNGCLIKKWVSAHEIERVLGYKQEAIQACCVGKEKTNGKGYKWVPRTSYGFIWKYEE